jgi:hypothetical protein
VSLKPTVTLNIKDEALEFTLSYIVDYTKRSAMQDLLYTKVVAAVNDSQGRLRWAI